MLLENPSEFSGVVLNIVRLVFFFSCILSWKRKAISIFPSSFMLLHILTGLTIPFSLSFFSLNPPALRAHSFINCAISPRHTGSRAPPRVPQPGVCRSMQDMQIRWFNAARLVLWVWCAMFKYKAPPRSPRTSPGRQHTSLIFVKMSHFQGNVSNSIHTITVKWFPAHELLSLMENPHFKHLPT